MKFSRRALLGSALGWSAGGAALLAFSGPSRAQATADQAPKGATRRFLDAHVHIWDAVANPSWYPDASKVTSGPLGDVSSMRKDFDLENYRKTLSHVDLIGCIHIAGAVKEHWRNEEQWIAQAHRRHGLPSAIVATLVFDQPDPNLEHSLHARLANPLLRGVRVGGLDFDSQAAATLMRVLTDRNLSLEVGVRRGGGSEVWRPIAERHPEVQFVLAHAGRPAPEERDDWAAWEKSVSEAAKAPNLSCKLSGMGMTYHRQDVEIYARYWKHCIDAFGPSRCMYGTNFPVDYVYGPFPRLLASFENAVSDLNPEHQDLVFWKTAADFYRVTPVKSRGALA